MMDRCGMDSSGSG